MAQPSSLQPLSGPLAGRKFEFHGGDVVVGSDADCAVRLDAPGVAGRHARITVSLTGAMIYALDGIVGVNDDRVTGDSLLRNGDFVWMGEPGGAASMMLQFTLGDVEEPAQAVVFEPAPSPAIRTIEPPGDMVMEEEVVEEVAEEVAPQAEIAEEILVEEGPPEMLQEEILEAPPQVSAAFPEPADQVEEVSPDLMSALPPAEAGLEEVSAVEAMLAEADRKSVV